MLIGKKHILPYDNVGVYIDQILKECAHKTALVDENTSITFKELGEKIQELLHLFDGLGLSQDSKIIVLMDSTYERSVAAYSIMRYGACYVPLDPDYPLERLKYILEDSKASLIITNFSQHPLLEGVCVNVINFKNYIKKDYKKAIKPRYPKANAAAYLIYTSGSTGKPKGVEIPHVAIVNHMLWIKKNFHFTEKDSFLFRTSPMFDASLWELLIPIFTGGTQLIPSKNTKLDLVLLQEFINTHKVTVVQFVPTFFREFLKRVSEKKNPSLRYIFLGGESVSSEIKKNFFKKFSKCKLVNLYGPTEATIDATSCIFTRKVSDWNSNIIGGPIFNTNLYVLDEDFKPVVSGQEGELYIGGMSLAKGYFNNPTMTKQKFVETSFGRLYRTGDLVKQMNNMLLYLGRVDDQVKINGIRIDLQEITSSIMLQFPAIKNCALLENNQTDILSGALVCFIEADKNNAPRSDQIKKFLEDFYPSALVPRHITILAQFPRLPNGKFDKTKLYHFLNKERIMSLKNIDGKDVYEQKLIHIWSHILDVPVTAEESFFDKGGNSIAVIQLSDQIFKEMRVNLSISDIIKNPTIEKQANLIKFTKALSKQGSATYPNNPIILLNTFHKNKPSIFLVHPIGGTIFWYINIAKHLEGVFNIYGIQDPDIEKIDHPPFLSIQDMSEFYGEKILELFHSEAPLIIGGASFILPPIKLSSWLREC